MKKEINKQRMQAISSNITKYRKERGITQKELAENIGITPSTLSDYINLRSAPSFGVIQKLADFFGVQKTDIDSEYQLMNNIKSTSQSSVLSKINQISSELGKSRQEKVLNFAKNEKKEQDEEDKKIVHLKDEQQKQSIDLADLVDDSKVDWDKWVSFDGRPLTDEVKEAMKQLLGKRLEDK
ncbi:helix-turn-helix domain-containing protein [Lactococcus lactis]|uniref:helix-turn-helix domain-containing protein n=1 Tax=Lactococcus lactis TaxID=1358 RepID=UPI00210E1CB6|nr:helix-turn-helix domain-containing protein [Lactococcus lactis]MCQ4972209.1 helix-turn-helix domain-containing protein [Lactococcus lactis]MCQ4998015.1 helix-turn-helix domain-containing protein [Lactococcus lactis]